MRTTWRVTKITMTEGRTMAELDRVEWFKPNPEFVARMAQYDALVAEFGEAEADRRSAAEPDAEVYYEETIEAEPGEPGAEWYQPGAESMTIDIHDGLDLVPGDNVFMTLDAVERVPA